MKIQTKALMTVAMLSTLLNAGTPFFNSGFESDFDRFNRYANRLFNAQLMNQSFDRYSYPKLNMSEEKDIYILKFELAGMDKSDIKLSVDENSILVLEGEKKAEIKEQNSTYFKEEFSYGKFKRAISLPKDANADKIETSYKDGILTIKIPKKEIKEPSSKVIEIK